MIDTDYLRFLWELLPNLLWGYSGQRPGGLLLSLLLALAAIGLGFLVALPVSSGLTAGWRPLRWLCRLYVESLRGLPLILLLVLIHQVVGGLRFGFNFSPRTSALVALTLYTSAYQAEILRSGLRTVPTQMVQSARLLGSSSWQVFRLVRLPYALHVMAPALTGQAISLFKDTSVVTIIGVAELMTMARVSLGSDVTYASYWVGLYLLVGGLYFLVAFGLAHWAQQWERRTQSADLVHSLAGQQ